MGTEPASRRTGRPTKEANARLELLAIKGETKRAVITIAPMVAKLARCQSQSQREVLESKVYAEFMRMLRRLTSEPAL